ncbi:hypothetical protein COCOBI_08-0120 [Coccomyxa sp. Obi]|nr:hypothetical protein COCOBI_08-0120 [Coccomyxa sp. Obi]
MVSDLLLRRAPCAQVCLQPHLYLDVHHLTLRPRINSSRRKQKRSTSKRCTSAQARASAPSALYEAETLARAGYTVISTPYAVTFKHLDCARSVHDKFNGCVEALRGLGQGFLVPEERAVHGIGHSNGALLHALIGAMFAPPNASNALISYNNKQVKDAIPLSLGPLQAAVANVRSQPWAAGVPSADSLITSAVGALSQSGLMLDERALRSIAPAIDQLNSVFNEVGDGTLEFIPTPAESRALVQSAYRVPYTLLIQFENDAIDETPEMTRVFRSSNPAGTSSLVLPGTHITPCGGDVDWQVGRSFSPVDAVALGVKAVVQADIRRLGDKLIGWLESHS